MSRLAAFASFCSQSPPCKSPMLNDVDVSPVCIKTPPCSEMSAVIVVEAVEEPGDLSRDLQSPHSVKLDPAAQEFRPELRTAQAVISSLAKQGHHLSVAAPSFVPRQLQNTQSLVPPQLPMPTESATGIPNTSCDQSVLLEDSSQARISGCLDRMRQIHARVPSILGFADMPLVAKDKEGCSAPPMMSFALPPASLMPIPPAPGTAVLRTQLQKMSRELEAMKLQAANAKKVKELECKLSNRLEELERETSSQRIVIAALRKKLHAERLCCSEQMTALRDAVHDTAEQNEQLMVEMRALQRENKSIRASERAKTIESKSEVNLTTVSSREARPIAPLGPHLSFGCPQHGRADSQSEQNVKTALKLETLTFLTQRSGSTTDAPAVEHKAGGANTNTQRSRRGGRGRGGVVKNKEKVSSAFHMGDEFLKENPAGNQATVRPISNHLHTNAEKRNAYGWQLRAAQQVLELNA